MRCGKAVAAADVDPKAAAIDGTDRQTDGHRTVTVSTTVVKISHFACENVLYLTVKPMPILLW